jgi:hypothetical protein
MSGIAFLLNGTPVRIASGGKPRRGRVSGLAAGNPWGCGHQGGLQRGRLRGLHGDGHRCRRVEGAERLHPVPAPTARQGGAHGRGDRGAEGRDASGAGRRWWRITAANAASARRASCVSMAVAHLNGARDHDDQLAGNLCRCTGYARLSGRPRRRRTRPVPDWMAADREALAFEISRRARRQPSGPPIPTRAGGVVSGEPRRGAGRRGDGCRPVGDQAAARPAPVAFLGGVEDLQGIERRAGSCMSAPASRSPRCARRWRSACRPLPSCCGAMPACRCAMRRRSAATSPTALPSATARPR